MNYLCFGSLLVLLRASIEWYANYPECERIEGEPKTVSNDSVKTPSNVFVRRIDFIEQRK